MNSLLLMSDAWKYSIIAIVIVVAVVLIALIIFFTRKSFKNNVVEEYEGDEDDDDDEDRPDPVYEEEPDEDEEDEKTLPAAEPAPEIAAEAAPVEEIPVAEEKPVEEVPPVVEEKSEEQAVPAKTQPEAKPAAPKSAISAQLADYSYNYSFRAKLTQSTPEMHERYQAIRNELKAYKGIRITDTWKAQTAYKGREIAAKLMYRGKTLCLALALDPKEYAETQYKGQDMSAKKAFAKTPMLLKLSSQRKVKYAVKLIDDLMTKKYGLEKGAVSKDTYDIDYETTEQLLEKGLIKQTKKSGGFGAAKPTATAADSTEEKKNN
ncbi:MAG: hypothetical protein LUD47_00970 [Clostridia bacterium]|nr:hypothetical protein [Clostridia bacterium]